MPNWPAADVVEAKERPLIVRLGPNLYGAVFSLMKLVPARHMLEQAQRDGRLPPGATVVETTSGTFGLALALVGCLRGLRVHLVSDPVIDAPLRRRIEDLGAVVELVNSSASGGIQRARLERLARLQAELPGPLYCPSQYDNPENAESYGGVAVQLLETLGPVDCLVGPVGSGGSMCGVISYLRTVNPQAVAVAVDTHGSVLFGQQDRPRVLRGLGNSVMPGNLRHALFDEVHWVTAAEAFLATRLLHRRHGLYMGGTSGAAYLVAAWWAAQHQEQLVTVLLPDEGFRYQDTIYDDGWLQSANLWQSALPPHPRSVEHPDQATPVWTRLPWGRRHLADVVGGAQGKKP